jgi:short-subunit dehydrogenase
MAGRFRNQRVLITGASAGIGRAAAVAFVEEGASVIATARSESRLRTLADELGGPPRLIAVVADVTDPDSVESMAERVLADGAPDVIVANAGIGLDALLVETSEESMRAVFETNVYGVVRTLRWFIPAMAERGSGRLVIVSSIVGKRGIPHYSIYSASKFALQGMAEALRAELHGSGVTVGVVCPASTETEFSARRLREGPSQSNIRPGRHTAESVATAIVKMAGSRRREIVLTTEGKALAWGNVLFPGLVDRLLSRLLVKRPS